MKIFHEYANEISPVARRLLGVAFAVVVVSACKGVFEEPGGSGPGPEQPSDPDPNLIGITRTDPCLTPAQSFASETYGPIFSRCIGCHNGFGLARQVGVELRLTFPGEPDFTERNVTLLTEYATRQVQATDGSTLPLLLAKPTGRISHVGGTVVPPDSPEGKLLASFVQKLQNPPSCAVVPEDKAQTALSSLELASPRQTYARAKFALTGELVTPEELDAFADTEEALDAKLDELMSTEAFLSRAQDMFADWLLTDAYSSLVRGRDLMNQLRDFPRNGFFEPLCTEEDQNNCCDAAVDACCQSLLDPAYCTGATNLAIDAVAREPLELVKHVVRNNLPLTELVTADYSIVNPYSARVYGFTDVQLAELFDGDPSNDATEFKLTRLVATPLNALRNGPDGGYPHAGILSMPSLMVRYPSSTSNQQRTRGARLVLDRLLAIPVMKLSDFSTASLPADADLELATQEYPACTVCHAAIDPVAGHFRNFGSTGQYRPGSRLPEHLPDPTFLDQAQTEGDTTDPLRFLSRLVATHDRFPLGVLMPVLADLIGAEILTPPTDVLQEGYAAKYLAFRIQQIEIQRLRREFSGPQALRLAPLVKSIVKGSFFRAVGAPALDETTREALSLAGVGAGTLLTPEQLARKIEHVTGLTYRSGLTPAGRDMFRSFQEFRLMFGGTDWDATPQRYREPNVMAVRIAMRTGNEMACLAVPQDFSIKAAAERRLFRHVEAGTTPENGGEAAIKGQIRRLHRFLLGEELPDGHTELEATYKLWIDTRSAGRAAIASRDISATLPTRCRATGSFEATPLAYPTETRAVVDQDPEHTVRSWMAVIAYLVSDARFFLQ